MLMRFAWAFLSVVSGFPTTADLDKNLSTQFVGRKSDKSERKLKMSIH